MLAKARKAGFAQTRVIGPRQALDKERLKLYPLFTVEFLDWLFNHLGEDCTPISTVHFSMVKPAQA
ncbi:MAG: hypothetical protein HY660_16580 [Armatimonadetes bacterium]|nr:hypothetical protein [Armatimonadota bacterium]